MRAGKGERCENALLTTPLVLFVLAFLGFPAIVDLLYSVSTVSFETLRTPALSGFGNYRAVLADDDFWQAAGFSLRFGVTTAVAECVLGLFLAVFLAPLLSRRPWLLGILMLPIMVAPAMVGLMYRLVLHEFVGPLPHYLYTWFGDSPAFLAPDMIFTTLVVIEILQWTPFVLLLCHFAHQGISSELREAATIDGARGWALFHRIELPLMMPTLAVALFIRFIDGFRVFDNVYTLVGSGPGGSTTSLSIYIYLAFFKRGDIGHAVAASVILFVVAFVLVSVCGRIPAWLVARRGVSR